MLPRIPNHLLSSILCFVTPTNTYHSKESTQGGIATQVWLARHNLDVVDYKALPEPSLMRVPHFRARHGASLKVIHLDTMSANITKCFLVS
jgi:hypothetical protein